MCWQLLLQLPNMLFYFHKAALHEVCFEKKFSGMVKSKKFRKNCFLKDLIYRVWKLFHLQSKGKIQITTLKSHAIWCTSTKLKINNLMPKGTNSFTLCWWSFTWVVCIHSDENSMTDTCIEKEKSVFVIVSSFHIATQTNGFCIPEPCCIMPGEEGTSLFQ